jgi:PST family polysaccharide transporter
MIRPDDHGAKQGLRSKIIQGGAFLAIRQGLGVVLSLVGVLLVTRIIGPHEYGLYAMAMSIVFFCTMIGPWGVDVYLLRKIEGAPRREFDQAFTLLLCIALVSFGLLLVLSQSIAALVNTPVAVLVMVQAIGLPFNLIAIPAVVKLDRDLNFKQVAINELISQACMYGLSVPLAFTGAGAWAPVSGWVLQQLVLMILSFRSSQYRPALCWDTVLIKKMLRYGVSYSCSAWVWQLRGLVNPVLVGRFLGAEAVGYVAISIRFVEVLTFARPATWRIAMAGLSRIATDNARLRRGVTEGMKLQALAVGIPLALFALIGPVLVPLGLGHTWTPALTVFPFIGVSYLMNAIFILHSSVLYLREKNVAVTVFHAVHVGLFAASATVLLPRLGVAGYGWAEMVALFSYPVLHRCLAKQIESPSYLEGMLWGVAIGGALAVSTLQPPFLYLGFALLVVPLLVPEERLHLAEYAKLLFPRVRHND